jgi:hypothetical protein
MADAKKMVSLSVVAIVSGFYRAFVLQNLWNWFVVGALNASPIGYWQMYGINMLAQIVMERFDSWQDEERWTRTLAMLYMCVPEVKRNEADEYLKEQNEGEWMGTGMKVFGSLAGNTVTLGFGWLIHTVLM